MRILLLAHAHSIHTRRWVEALAARGHDLRLLSTHDTPDSIHVSARRVGWSVPFKALRYASACGAVREEVRSFHPDVAVAHFLPNYGFLAALAGARPMMLVCWGSDLLVNATRTPLHRARARWTLRRAGAIHVDAANLADAAVGLGAEPNRIWTRAWGIDVDALAPTNPWGVRRARSAALRILWTRQLEPIYDPKSLIRGLGLLARKGVAFQATLLGSGSMRRSLEALARREGVVDAVTFTGWVDTPRLAAFYQGHEVYVSLSLSDSTSQSLLEAMAAGLVPVVTDIAGNREWVTHRREGLLVPVGDPEAVACALAEVSREPEAADAMAAKSRHVVSARARFADTLTELEVRLRALAGSGSDPANDDSGCIR